MLYSRASNCEKVSFLSFNSTLYVIAYQKTFLIPHQLLTNFEIQKYHENEPRFNGVYSRDNFPKTIEDGAYMINLDDHRDVATYLIALYCINIEIIYFESF